MPQGFSLTEVYIALLLVSTVTVGVLKTQWQSSHWFSQFHARLFSLTHLENTLEQRVGE